MRSYSRQYPNNSLYWNLVSAALLFQRLDRLPVALERTYSTSYDNRFYGHPLRNHLLINRPPRTWNIFRQDNRYYLVSQCDFVLISY